MKNKIDNDFLKRMQELAVIRSLDETLQLLRSRPAYENDGRTWKRLEIDFRDVENSLNFRVDSSGNKDVIGPEFKFG